MKKNTLKAIIFILLLVILSGCTGANVLKSPAINNSTAINNQTSEINYTNADSSNIDILNDLNNTITNVTNTPEPVITPDPTPTPIVTPVPTVTPYDTVTPAPIPTPEPVTTARLSGKVINSSGTPFPGVEMTIVYDTTGELFIWGLSGQNGYYSIYGIPYGTYNVILAKNGYGSSYKLIVNSPEIIQDYTLQTSAS